MIIENQGDYWTCQGDGPLRPILVEGLTRKHAKDIWEAVYGHQYEENARMEHFSLQGEGEDQ